MKKYIFSVLMAVLTAFTFSSCADVPEPYTQPSKPETPGETTEGTPKGTGTASDPYNCAAAIQYCKSLDGAESTNDVYVKGTVQSIEEQFNSNYGNASVTLVDEDGSTTFKVWRAYYFDNKKWTASGKELKVGDEVVFCGKVINYSGNTPETVQGKAWLVSINGEGGNGNNPDTPTTGKGSESDPYTVAEAIEVIKAGAPSTEVYLTGIISEVSYYNETYKSITYYISDDGKSKDMQVYSGKGLNGADFTSKDDLKVGQKVTIKGIIKAFTDKNGNTIMEVDKTSSIIKIENGGGTVTPDQPEGSDIEMTTATIESGKSGSEVLPERTYGSQDVTKEATWYTWKNGGVTFMGAKITKAETGGDYAGTLQMQGNKDVAKQGFIFNSTAFAKDIKSITITFEGASTYDTPTTFSVFEGSAAHPTNNKVEGKYTKTSKNDKVNVFTMTYDFNAVSSKYFTIWNNAAGALYIEKIIVTLK